MGVKIESNFFLFSHSLFVFGFSVFGLKGERERRQTETRQTETRQTDYVFFLFFLCFIFSLLARF